MQNTGKVASPSSSIDKATLPSFTTLFDYSYLISLSAYNFIASNLITSSEHTSDSQVLQRQG